MVWSEARSGEALLLRQTRERALKRKKNIVLRNMPTLNVRVQSCSRMPSLCTFKWKSTLACTNVMSPYKLTSFDFSDVGVNPQTEPRYISNAFCDQIRVQTPRINDPNPHYVAISGRRIARIPSDSWLPLIDCALKLMGPSLPTPNAPFDTECSTKPTKPLRAAFSP